MPKLLSALVGCLILLLTLFVIGAEFTDQAWVEAAAMVVSVLLLASLVAYVARSRQVFVWLALLLSVANTIWNPDWRQTLASGGHTAAFICAFFSALSMLKFAAESSPSIARCGLFLAQQPAGRRYLALSLGGQLFGLLLNYGAISLLGSMSASQDHQQQEGATAQLRLKRMLLAIQRGFISILPWSPFSFAIAIPTHLIAGASWAGAALPGLVSGLILVLSGWLMDRMMQSRQPSAAAHSVSQQSWSSLKPLWTLLLIMAVLILGSYALSGVRIVILVTLLVPLVALVWIALQAPATERYPSLRRRSAEILLNKLADFRGELVLLMMAGYLGTVAAPLLSSLMQQIGVDPSAWPGAVILLLLVWLIPLLGQIGMNPILAATLLVPLVPDAATLGTTPAAVVAAVTAGWILSGVSSPFTATTLLVGKFAGVSSFVVGLRWNGVYTLLCAVLLSLWVLSFAALQR